jgi:hypothetical protein
VALQNLHAVCEVERDLDHTKCNVPHGSSSKHDCGDLAVANAKALEVPTLLESSDICGSTKLAALLCAELLLHSSEFNPIKSAELDAICDYVNKYLKDDEDSQPYLPLDVPILFDQLCDGVVLSRLISKPQPGMVPDRAVLTPPQNMQPASLSVLRKKNAEGVLKAAINAGCKVAGVTPENIVNGDEEPVTELLGEILRLQALSDLPHAKGAEMDALIGPGETAKDLEKLPGEEIAARWMRKHLEKAGVPPRGPSADDVLQDEGALCAVQVDVAPAQCSLPAGGANATPATQADAAVKNAKAMGVPTVMEGHHLTRSPKLARLFAAQNLKSKLAADDLPRLQELDAMCDYVNKYLKDDAPSAAYLPLTLGTMLDQLNDGVILARLVNVPKPGSVDDKAVVAPAAGLQPTALGALKRSNADVVLRGAASAGANVSGISPESVANGEEEPVCRALWEVLRLQALTDLPNAKGKEMETLVVPAAGESVSSLRSLPGEEIAARWMRKHLEKAGAPVPGPLADDVLQDQGSMSVVQCDLSPSDCSKARAGASVDEKADVSVNNARAMAVPTVMEGRHLVKSPKLARLFAAQNLKHRLALDDLPRLAELDALCDYINKYLKDDAPSQRYLPLAVPTMFDQLSDGVVLSRLVNVPKPGTIDDKAVVPPPKGIQPGALASLKKRNADGVLKGASSVGCKVAGVTPENIVNGDEEPVTELLGEILRLQALSDLPHAKGAEMDALIGPGETAKDLEKLPGEEIAARWMRKHLEKAGVPPRGPSADDVLQDEGALCAVQVDVAPAQCSLPAGGANATPATQADAAVKNAKAMGVPTVMEGHHLTRSPKLARLFAAQNLKSKLAADDLPRLQELDAMCDYVNKYLKDDAPSAAYLPLTLGTMLDQLNDGVILARLVNVPKPGSVDDKAVVAPAAGLQPTALGALKRSNADVVLRGAASAGANVSGISPESVANGEEEPVCRALWEVLRLQALTDLPNAKGKEMETLVVPAAGESVSSLRSLPGEEIAARWMRKHLEKAGAPVPGPLADDVLQDQGSMSVVQCDLSPSDCSKARAGASVDEKADVSVNNARAMAVPTVMEGRHLVKSPKLARLFAAQNLKHRLALDDLPRLAELDALCDYINKYLKDDAPSQRYLPLAVPTMFDQLSDGVVLSRLVNVPKPGTIDDKAVVPPPKGIQPGALASLKKRNVDEVLKGAVCLSCDVQGVSAEDIVNGNEDIVSKVVWEVLRLQGLSDLPSQTGPEMDALAHPGENVHSLIFLHGEEIATRWMHRHLLHSRASVNDRKGEAVLADHGALCIVQRDFDSARSILPHPQSSSEKKADAAIRNAMEMQVPTIMESKHILKSSNLSKLFVAQNMLFKLFLDQLEAAELKEEAALAAAAVDPGEAERRAGEEAARLAAEAAARRKAELEAQRKAAEEEAARRAAEEEEKRKADELARLLAEEALANADGLETDVTPEADASDDDEDLEPQIRRLIKKYPILLFQNAHDPEAAGK